METQPFGKTGLTVTRLGLGMAALGRPGYMTLGHADDLGRRYDLAEMQAHAHTVLDAAYAAGIRYFDVARSYGEGERFLKSWLTARDLTPEMVTVGSKWGYTYTAGWKVDAEKHEIKDHSLSVLRRQTGESWSILGIHLRLYHIHSATLESGVLEDAGVLRELARLRSEGLTIGLSVTGARQGETLKRAMDIVMDGAPLFGSVQATWNILETSAAPALARAHAAGMGVIVKEGLANGRLTPRNTDPAFAPRLRVLAQTAADLGTTVDALCLAAAISQPWADVVLSGAATVDQIRSNAAAVAVPWDEEAAAAVAGLSQDSKAYWSARAGLRWN
jgi:aryl-alcohol dehydrogenase-like predicted oxidoreductase